MNKERVTVKKKKVTLARDYARGFTNIALWLI